MGERENKIDDRKFSHFCCCFEVAANLITFAAVLVAAKLTTFYAVTVAAKLLLQLLLS